jgi:chromosome segregation ATPase
MKAAINALVLLMVVHVIAAIGFVGWLAATDRLSKDRLADVRDTFKLTLAAEAEQDAQAEELAKQAQAEADRHARLTGASGLGSAAERLAAEEERNELLLRQLERTRRELEDLQRNLHLARQNMERQRDDLVQAKADLEKRLKEIETRLNDEGFKKAVALYEQLPAKRVKPMFATLMTQGQTDQVVAYLEAMEPRKAAKVLAEFKAEAELGQAVDLTERLRARGSAVVSDVEDTG